MRFGKRPFWWPPSWAWRSQKEVFFGGFWWLLLPTLKNYCFALCWTFSKTRTANRTKDLPPLLSNSWLRECLNKIKISDMDFGSFENSMLKLMMPTLRNWQMPERNSLAMSPSFLKTIERRTRIFSLAISMICIIWCQGIKVCGCRMVG